MLFAQLKWWTEKWCQWCSFYINKNKHISSHFRVIGGKWFGLLKISDRNKAISSRERYQHFFQTYLRKQWRFYLIPFVALALYFVKHWRHLSRSPTLCMECFNRIFHTYANVAHIMSIAHWREKLFIGGTCSHRYTTAIYFWFPWAWRFCKGSQWEYRQ